MSNLTSKFLTVSQSNGGLVFELGNGKKLTFNPSEVGQQVREQAELHGFNQKIRDAAAGFSKTSDYSGAFAEMADVIESLKAGEWNRRGGGGAGQAMQDLAAAIAKIKGCGEEVAMAAVRKADPEQRKAWLKNGKVALAVQEIQSARLKMQAANAEDIDIELK